MDNFEFKQIKIKDIWALLPAKREGLEKYDWILRIS